MIINPSNGCSSTNSAHVSTVNIKSSSPQDNAFIGQLESANEDHTGYIVSSTTKCNKCTITNSTTNDVDSLPSSFSDRNLSNHCNVFDATQPSNEKKKEKMEAIQIIKYLNAFDLNGHNYFDNNFNTLSINYIVEGDHYRTDNVYILRPIYADKYQKDDDQLLWKLCLRRKKLPTKHLVIKFKFNSMITSYYSILQTD